MMHVCIAYVGQEVPRIRSAWHNHSSEYDEYHFNDKPQHPCSAGYVLSTGTLAQPANSAVYYASSTCSYQAECSVPETSDLDSM